MAKTNGKVIIKKEDITIRALIDAHPSVPWPINAISKLNKQVTKNKKAQKVIDNMILGKSLLIRVSHLPIPSKR